MAQFELVNLEGNEEVLTRIKQLEEELSQQLERPVALIAYTQEEDNEE